MSRNKNIIKQLESYRREEQLNKIKKACIDSLFPNNATQKECICVCEKQFNIKISHKKINI
ncbi:hypothetical protein [Campylobacter suis]|uniref:Uncharacterized protein n=1 Tax=Campylobacter suis TaxID=2790657 RepID=A0ABM8Q231_9BACT|nr:hypothetical protein [Campylobacter suis]CAD7286880.1 hypothetical protein LMG8286_00586 [Campylobacter suis]